MCPKTDGSCHMIVDISWPHGNILNNWIQDDVFDDMDCMLCYPSIDHIIQGRAIAVVGPDALLLKIDLKRAYQNLRTDYHDFSALDLQWREQVYLDVSMPKIGAST